MRNLDAKLAKMTPDDMAEFLGAASAAYYNTSVSVISDDIYDIVKAELCLLYTSPSPRDLSTSRMPSSA